MNRRRSLNGIHTTMARKKAQGINAAAWFAGQSFHQSAADLPFEQIPVKELDKAGASLLPKAEPVVQHICPYCTNPLTAGNFQNFPYCDPICAINAQGDSE